MRVVNHHSQRQLQLLADQEPRPDIAKRLRTHRAGEAKLHGTGELLLARASVGVWRRPGGPERTSRRWGVGSPERANCARLKCEPFNNPAATKFGGSVNSWGQVTGAGQ